MDSYDYDAHYRREEEEKRKQAVHDDAIRTLRERAEAAEASKAQLVREVREWVHAVRWRSRPCKSHWAQIAEILDRHASDAEHPDTVRLRELVTEILEARKGTNGAFMGRMDDIVARFVPKEDA